jgi:predicted metalloprotease with PDZ domain
MMLGVLLVLAAMIFIDTPSSAQRSKHPMVFGSNMAHGRLGVMIEDVTSHQKKEKNLSVSSGALVTDVIDESPADKAGIEEGDVIVKFNDKQIEESDDLTRAVRKAKPDSDVQIEIVRKNEHKTLTVTLGSDDETNDFAFHFTPRPMPKIPRMTFNWRSFNESEIGGMELQELSKQLADYFEAPNHHGLLVTEVHPGSDAEKAGAKAGDVVVKVNDASVRDIGDFRDELKETKNHEAAVEVVRKGKLVTLKLHVEEDDEDDDASIGQLGALSCPDAQSPGIRAKIFSKEFLHDLMESIQDIKTHILRRVEDATEHIKTAFVKITGGKTDTTSHFHQS